MNFYFFQTLICVVTLLMIILCCLNTTLFMKKLWNTTQNKYDFLATFLISSVVFLIGYGCMVISDHYSVDSFNLGCSVDRPAVIAYGRHTRQTR